MTNVTFARILNLLALPQRHIVERLQARATPEPPTIIVDKHVCAPHRGIVRIEWTRRRWTTDRATQSLTLIWMRA